MSGLEILATVASVAATGVQTAQAYTAAKSTAAIEDANAHQAFSDANVEEFRRRRSNERRLADARVKMAGSGFSLDGSVADVLADMAAEAELEALSVRTEGERQSRYHTMQANAARKQATGALIGGALKTVSTLATDGMDQGWFSPSSASKGGAGGKG